MDQSVRVRDPRRSEDREHYREEKKRSDSYNDAFHTDSNGVENRKAKKQFASLAETPASLPSRLYQRAAWIYRRVRTRRYKTRALSRTSAYSASSFAAAFASMMLLYVISTQFFGLHISLVPRSSSTTAGRAPEPKVPPVVGVTSVLEHSQTLREGVHPAVVEESKHLESKESGPKEADTMSWSALADKLKSESSPNLRVHTLRTAFAQARKRLLQEENEAKHGHVRSNELAKLEKLIKRILNAWLREIDTEIRENRAGSVRWLPSYLLPPVDDIMMEESPGVNVPAEDDGESALDEPEDGDDTVGEVLKDWQRRHKSGTEFFNATRSTDFDTYHNGRKAALARNLQIRQDARDDETHDDRVPGWMKDWSKIQSRGQPTAPAIDYTSPTLYQYPVFRASPSDPDHYAELPNVAGERALLSAASPDMERAPPYPLLRPFETIYERWPQDDDVPVPHNVQITASSTGGQKFSSPVIVETLQHFDFQNEEHMKAAVVYREAGLPFKVYNVPEIQNVMQLWTDEYVASNFLDPNARNRRMGPGDGSNTKYVLGAANADTGREGVKHGHLANARGQESVEYVFSCSCCVRMNLTRF
jgi:hypothetical protein